MTTTPEGSLDQYVPEKDFLALLDGPGADFYRLSNTLLATPDERFGEEV